MRTVAIVAQMFLVGLVVAVIAPPPFQTFAASAEEPYSAQVTAREARVVFPVPAIEEWEWCRPETSNAGLEYGWTATVENHEQEYKFGFFLFKCLRSGPTTGAFDMLLQAGQMGVTSVQPTGGRFLRDSKVGAVTTATRLTLVVNDIQTLRLLFSERPTHATLRAHLPGEPEVVREAAIIYSQP